MKKMMLKQHVVESNLDSNRVIQSNQIVTVVEETQTAEVDVVESNNHQIVQTDSMPEIEMPAPAIKKHKHRVG